MSLKKQVILGLKWTSFATICLALVAILKISILARFLEKSDFGLMALVTFVMGFMNLFSDMGLSTAILHKQKITKKNYASLYWFNIIICIVLYGALFLVTPLVSSLYNEPELNYLIPLLGLNLIISGIGIQFKTIETKNLAFKSISLIDILAAIISLFVAVWLAVNDYGVLSLVYSALIQYLISNLLFLIIGIKKHGLLLHFRLTETLPFLKIGIYQVGGQVANYFNRDLDILLIGKFFSTEILGGYSLAKQLVFRPAQIINPILVKVASPTLAKFQNQNDLLKKNYLKLINIVSSLNIPVYLVIVLFAPLIVQIVYGPDFYNIVNLVRILSFYMIFRAIGNPIGSLVIATGRTDLEFKWNVMSLLIMPIFIYIGSMFGVAQVSLSLTFAMILLFVPSWKFLVNKMTGATLREYIIAIINIKFDFISKTKNH